MEPMAGIDDLNSQRFYHGTRTDLKQGAPIEPDYSSNYGQRKHAACVYLTATLDAATWRAGLARELRVTGGVMDWQGHPPEALMAMKEKFERLCGELYELNQ
jgi:Rifampin ADP-ribosyl transferase